LGCIYRNYKGRKYFDAVLVEGREENYQEAEENYILSSFTIGMPHQILLGLSAGHQWGWERKSAHTQFWCGKCQGREHLEDLGADGRII
jgi:hypothetical protein